MTRLPPHTAFPHSHHTPHTPPLPFPYLKPLATALLLRTSYLVLPFALPLRTPISLATHTHCFITSPITPVLPRHIRTAHLAQYSPALLLRTSYFVPRTSLCFATSYFVPRTSCFPFPAAHSSPTAFITHLTHLTPHHSLLPTPYRPPQLCYFVLRTSYFVLPFASYFHLCISFQIRYARRKSFLAYYQRVPCPKQGLLFPATRSVFPLRLGHNLLFF